MLLTTDAQRAREDIDNRAQAKKILLSDNSLQQPIDDDDLEQWVDDMINEWTDEHKQMLAEGRFE